MKDRKLIAALALRNQGSRLYGKPLQNLDVKKGITVLANILACLRTVSVLMILSSEFQKVVRTLPLLIMPVMKIFHS